MKFQRISYDSPISKLSLTRKRIFPLSLFSTPEPQCQLGLFTNQIIFSTSNESPAHTKSLPRKRRIAKIIPKLALLPEKQHPNSSLFTYRQYKNSNLREKFNSKIKKFTLKPLCTSLDLNERILRNRQKTEKSVRNSQDIKRNRISRVDISKIIRPAGNYGEVVLRVNDLVIEPLQQEIISDMQNEIH